MRYPSPAMPTAEQRRAYNEHRRDSGICRDCPEPARPGNDGAVRSAIESLGLATCQSTP